MQPNQSETKTPREMSSEEVLGALRDGAQMWRPRDGGSADIHKDGVSVKGVYCPDSVFHYLDEKAFITQVQKDVGGYPHYDDNARFDVFEIAKPKS